MESKVCIIDIETDGLDPTVIHCAAAKSDDRGLREFLSRDEFSEYLE